MDILANALEYIKQNQTLKLHFISKSDTDTYMDFVLNYNNNSRRYDYILRYDDQIEMNRMDARSFLRESQNDIFVLIELINTRGNVRVLYNERTRTLPAPKRPRRN